MLLHNITASLRALVFAAGVVFLTAMMVAMSRSI
jgi:hypothetical protein